MELSQLFDIIIDASKSGQVLVLAGAGVSRNFPTCLPIAGELMSEILTRIEMIASSKVPSLVSYRSYFLKTPFEGFISRLQQAIGEEIIDFLKCYDNGHPNKLHTLIANCLVSGHISCILTTNFDRMFEIALSDHVPQIRFVYGLNHVSLDTLRQKPLIVKAHGSLRDHTGQDISQTILTTVESISTKNAIDWLSDLFTGQLILVLGYSGGDRLDILPALRLTKNSRIIWVEHTNDYPVLASPNYMSPHIAEVIINSKGFFVKGDTMIFGNLLGQALQVENKLEETFGKCNDSDWVQRLNLKHGHEVLLAGMLMLALGFGEQKLAAQLFEEFLHENGGVSSIYSARASVAYGQTRSSRKASRCVCFSFFGNIRHRS